MPTLRFKATKMSDAKVSFISLVERGANRIPFKITKQEHDMNTTKAFSGLDLTNLFVRKSEPKAPVVVGVAAMKSELESLKDQLISSGVSLESVVDMEDGSVVLKQDSDFSGEGEVIRVNEYVALVTKGFAPREPQIDLGGTSFIETCKSDGYFPGIGSTIEVMRDAIIDVIEKSESRADSSEAVGAIFDSVRNYIQDMALTLPAIVAKAEYITPDPESDFDGDLSEMIEKGCKKKKVAEDEVSDEEVEKGFPPKKKPVMDGPEEETTEEVDNLEEEAEEVPPKKKKVSKAEGLMDSEVRARQMEAAIQNLILKMDQSFATISSKVDTAVNEIGARVAVAEQIAKEATDKISGFAIQGAISDDRDTVRKASSGYAGREIDTAFMPNVRRVSR